MIGHSVDRLIYELNGLKEETEQLIDEIDHMIVEEDKVYAINY